MKATKTYTLVPTGSKARFEVKASSPRSAIETWVQDKKLSKAAARWCRQSGHPESHANWTCFLFEGKVKNIKHSKPLMEAIVYPLFQNEDGSLHIVYASTGNQLSH